MENKKGRRRKIIYRIIVIIIVLAIACKLMFGNLAAVF